VKHRALRRVKMIDAIITYFANGWGRLIEQTVFVILGGLFGLLLSYKFTPKKKNSIIQNSSTFQETRIYIIQQVFVQKKEYTNNQFIHQKTKTSQQSDKGMDNMYIFIGILFLAGLIYSKYHSLIMNSLANFTVFALTSTITLIILLYRNNNLGKLNQRWICLMLLLIVNNFLTLYFMSKQEINIDGDFLALMRIIYYALGFFMVIIPNFILILLSINLLAVNSYIARQGKISTILIKRTSFFLRNPKSLATSVLGISLFSILFSSGLTFEFLNFLQNINANKPTEPFK
jgi:hypothetical protein